MHEIWVIVNGNPTSRAKVEDGDTCLRTNENGVDLNRNWDSYWQKVFLCLNYSLAYSYFDNY